MKLRLCLPSLPTPCLERVEKIRTPIDLLEAPAFLEDKGNLAYWFSRLPHWVGFGMDSICNPILQLNDCLLSPRI